MSVKKVNTKEITNDGINDGKKDGKKSKVQKEKNIILKLNQ